MLPENLKRNENEIAAIEALVARGEDRPVLMLNMNTYKAGTGYPSGGLYGQYIGVLEGVLARLGARIAWRTPVFGQPVGEQLRVDEILGIWYPSHQAFLNFSATPGADENYRLRGLCVQRAVIHRCSGENAPLHA